MKENKREGDRLQPLFRVKRRKPLLNGYNLYLRKERSYSGQNSSS